MATIMLVGGGSGGHITPLQAAAAELKKLAPDVQLVYVGQKGDSSGEHLRGDKNFDEFRSISAGKFRRYNGNKLGGLFNPMTFLKNFRDFFRVVLGTWQSFLLLRKVRPEVVFIKGGFVGVPVGLAARLLDIKFITHDSDAVPGLANRIIGRWAEVNTVALAAGEYKSYSKEKIVSVGVPVRPEFRSITTQEQKLAKKGLGLGEFEKVILVTGGGLGADRLNKLFLSIVAELLNRYDGLAIVHVAGEGLAKSVELAYDSGWFRSNRARITVLGYCSNLYDYSAAADVILTRAGATALAEFAVQRKACIIVPNAELTKGHQLVNARILENEHAGIVVREGIGADKELLEKIELILDNQAVACALRENISRLGKPDSSELLAANILRVGSIIR